MNSYCNATARLRLPLRRELNLPCDLTGLPIHHKPKPGCRDAPSRQRFVMESFARRQHSTAELYPRNHRKVSQ